MASGENPQALRAADWMRHSFADQITELTHRVDIAFGEGHPKKIIQFISAQRGEGVSAVAAAYAGAVADIMKRRVLLLGVEIEAESQAAEVRRRQDGAGDAPKAIVDMKLGGRPMSEAFIEISPRLSIARFATPLINRNEVLFTISAAAFWSELKENFDEIVIDSPAVAVSHLGMLISSHADGVVIVVAAERTRAPVIQAMLDGLADMRANILGAIFNQRRYHVPEWLYSRL